MKRLLAVAFFLALAGCGGSGTWLPPTSGTPGPENSDAACQRNGMLHTGPGCGS